MKALTQKNTLLKTAKVNARPKFLREYFFIHPKKKFNFFSLVLRCFIFFANGYFMTTRHFDWIQIKIIKLPDTEEDARTGNSVYKK